MGVLSLALQFESIADGSFGVIELVGLTLRLNSGGGKCLQQFLFLDRHLLLPSFHLCSSSIVAY